MGRLGWLPNGCPMENLSLHFMLHLRTLKALTNSVLDLLQLPVLKPFQRDLRFSLCIGGGFSKIQRGSGSVGSPYGNRPGSDRAMSQLFQRFSPRKSCFPLLACHFCRQIRPRKFRSVLAVRTSHLGAPLRDASLLHQAAFDLLNKRKTANRDRFRPTNVAHRRLIAMGKLFNARAVSTFREFSKRGSFPF